jgi:hypothetical protein
MIGALSALLLAAALPPGGALSVDPTASTFIYHVVHKLHRVDGASHQVEGKALAIEPQPDGALRVRGHLDVSLDAHGVERPSLLFVKIEDACGIDVDLLLRRDRS